MDTFAILINANNEAIAQIELSADTDMTAIPDGCTLLSESFFNEYIAANGVSTVEGVLADLGISDLRPTDG